MKKILAIVLTVAMLLSMSVVATAAANVYGGSQTPTAGAYAGGSAADFSPVGDIDLAWVPDAAEKFNLTDGKVEEWADLTPVTISANNVISWVGNDNKAANGGEGAPDSNMPADWGITAYFAADPTYLYIAFYITDDNVVDVAAGESYRNGDHFQINMDFGGKLGDLIENDPDTAELMSNTQNVFYSFAYAGDGQPITVFRDCSDDDRKLNNVEPYKYVFDSDEDEEPQDAVVGASAKTPNGWSAEFRLPWEMLYDDYATKGWLSDIEDTRIYIGGEDKKPLTSGIGLYYCNQSYNEDNSKSGINWAAGTSNGVLMPDESGPAVAWDAYDNGIKLVLDADPTLGISFTTPKIHVLMENETEPPTEEKTEAPTDPETEPKPDDEDEETEAPTAGATDAPTAGGDDGTADDGKGCASVIGASAAIILCAAAAVVLKKKD